MGQALSTNASYRITIQRGIGSALAQPAGAATVPNSPNFMSVQANAQAKLNIKLENHWVNVLEAVGYEGDSGSSLLANTLNGFKMFTGNNFLPELFTSHVWRASNGIEIQIALRFDAWNSAGQDVLTPVENLAQMFAPYRDGQVTNTGVIGDLIPAAIGNWFLHPPGPTPSEYLSGNAAQFTITVMLGKVLIIPNLIPVAFDWEFENRFTTNGYPVCANVNASFMSYTLPTQSDIIAMFRLAVSGVS